MWPFGDASEVRNYYDEGMKAYAEGKEMWQCPHVTGSSSVLALTPWMAGWMYAKQLDEATKKDKYTYCHT